MVVNIEENGKTENNTEKASFLTQKIIHGKKDYGMMVKE